MTTEFDPYRKWLGIPQDEQPANHYRLLGIGEFEDDPDVIDNAADRQMAHVQTFKSGPHSKLTQQLLNQLSAAKLCLLDPPRKLAYDSQLRASRVAQQPAVPLPVAQAAIPQLPPQALPTQTLPTQTLPTGATPDPHRLPLQAAPAGQPVFVSSKPGPHSQRSKKRKKDFVLYAASLTIALLILVVVAIVANSSRDADDDAPNASTASREEPSDGDNVKPVPPVETASSENAGPQAVPPAGENPPAEHVPATLPPDKPDQPDDEKDPEPATPEPAVGKPPTVSLQWKSSPFSASDRLITLVSDTESAAQDFPFAFDESTERVQAVPPDGDEHRRALREVRDTFQDEFSGASTAEKKFSLAKRLYEIAMTETRGDIRFALMAEAHDLVLASDRVSSATRIAEIAVRLFQLEESVIRTSLLEGAVQSFPPDAPLDSIVIAALLQVDHGTRQLDFDLARTLLGLGRTHAGRANNPAIAQIAESFAAELPLVVSQFRTARQAVETLSNSPKDPQASLTAGSYLCFVLGDWPQGLPLLANSSDQALNSVALADLRSPLDADQRAQLGDQWWDLLAAADPSAKKAIQSRAGHWYELALGQLTGLARQRVQNRLTSLQVEGKTEATGDLPRSAKEFVGRYVLYAVNPKSNETRASIWELNGDLTATENGEVVGRWEAHDATRLKITLTAAEQTPVFLRFRGAKLPMTGARTSPGVTWKWEFTRLGVAGVWEHKTESITVFGREIPGETETLTFYSNGRINDPLGDVAWAVQARKLLIDWGSGKKTTAVLSQDGKSYSGKTTRPTGFGRTTISLPVNGRQVGAAP